MRFILAILIPQTSSFDGFSERSITILDNCAIHHVSEVIDEFRIAGILVIFLPPYSPDYMPIELCFSNIKYYLKDRDELVQVLSDPKQVHLTVSQDNNARIGSRNAVMNNVDHCCYILSQSCKL